MDWQPSSVVVCFSEPHDGGGLALHRVPVCVARILVTGLIVTVEELPNQQTSQSPQPRTMRVVHVSVQPKTWFGKLIAGIIGVVVILVAFFLSILVFAIIASIVVIVIIYVFWATHRARRAMRNQTIDGVVKNCDIR
jgi:VIT1/CCC1 family predicted Fe2+/Mn2+ transporter